MAICISIGNGKVKFVSIEEALDFDFQEAWASGEGMDLNNPYFDGAVADGEELVFQETTISIEIPEVDLEDIPIEELDFSEEDFDLI